MAKYLSLPGSSGHYVATPENAAFDISTAIEYRMDILLPDYSLASVPTLMGRWNGSGGLWSYLGLNSDSDARFQPTTGTDKRSTVRLDEVISNGTRVHYRVTANPAAPEVIFYYRTNTSLALTSDTGWSQLGDALTSAFTLTASANEQLLIGGRDAGTGGLWAGRVYRGMLYNGIGGTVVADFHADDFDVGDSSGATAVDSTGKTWTIAGANSTIAADPTPSTSQSSSPLLLGI